MNDRTIVYIFLSGLALYLLKEGILLYVEDATIFHESEVKLEDLSDQIEWPDLQVCSSPCYKSKDKLKEFESKSTSFQDENEYNTYADAAFFTKVNEILSAINIGFVNDYMEILNNTNTIPLEEPYVKPTIIDFANSFISLLSAVLDVPSNTHMVFCNISFVKSILFSLW